MKVCRIKSFNGLNEYRNRLDRSTVKLYESELAKCQYSYFISLTHKANRNAK